MGVEEQARWRIAFMATGQVWLSSVFGIVGVISFFATGQWEALGFAAFAALSVWWWLPVYRATQRRLGRRSPSVDQLVASAEADFKAGRIDQAEFERRVEAAWKSE